MNRTLPQWDNDAFEAWARSTHDIADSVAYIKPGSQDDTACLWLGTFGIVGPHRLSWDQILVPEYPGIRELCAAFPPVDEVVQLPLWSLA